MQPTETDIRKALEERINSIQTEIQTLEDQRLTIMNKLVEAVSHLDALKVIYKNELEHFGTPNAPLFPQSGKSYRFAGKKLVQALRIIRAEQPEINKEQAVKLLQKEGFDFKGKRPLTAVHFCWIAIDRKAKNKTEEAKEKDIPF